MEKETKHYIYILKCSDGTLYTGYTTDIDRRLNMHNNGKGAKYTRGRGPFKLVYCEQFSTKREAMQMEYKVKQLSKGKKEELINSYQKGHDGNENTK